MAPLGVLGRKKTVKGADEDVQVLARGQVDQEAQDGEHMRPPEQPEQHRRGIVAHAAEQAAIPRCR